MMGAARLPHVPHAALAEQRDNPEVAKFVAYDSGMSMNESIAVGQKMRLVHRPVSPL